MHPFLLHYPVLFSNVSAGGAPDWVLRGGSVPASLDIDFVNDRVWGGTSIAALLSCSRGTGGYYLNADGTLTWFASNTLRYGTNGLLVEEQRTNLCTRSQDFGDAAWATYGVGCSKTGASATLAPDGTATAYEIALGTDGGAIGAAGAVYQSINVTNGVTYTGSVYVRAKTGTTSCRISVSSGGIDGSADVSLTTTWQRITVTHTATATVSGNIAIRNNTAGNSGSILVWGAQLEAGSFATSYIPTTSGSATRSADVITGSLSPTLNTFTMYTEALASSPLSGSVEQWVCELFVSGSESTNRVHLGRYLSAGTPTFESGQNSPGVSGSAVGNVGAQGDGSTFKIAVGVTAGAQSASLNGATVVTGTRTPISSHDTYQLGGRNGVGNYWNGFIKRFSLFNSKVSNANLQTLTA